MIGNALWLCMPYYSGPAGVSSRLRHAASIRLTEHLGIRGPRLLCLTFPVHGVQGISVPIGRGSPPDLIR